jgi:hypothetical protein
MGTDSMITVALAGAPSRPERPAAAQCHQAPFMYEMKGA